MFAPPSTQRRGLPMNVILTDLTEMTVATKNFIMVWLITSPIKSAVQHMYIEDAKADLDKSANFGLINHIEFQWISNIISTQLLSENIILSDLNITFHSRINHVVKVSKFDRHYISHLHTWPVDRPVHRIFMGGCFCKKMWTFTEASAVGVKPF